MDRKQSLGMLMARGADTCMHAALHLVGAHYPGLNYSDPRVWLSDDPAVILLLERYSFLTDALDYAWALSDGDY
jgi:hypothetical protein